MKNEEWPSASLSTVQNFPSWTGGVPSPMSEANRTRWGGGFLTVRDAVILNVL